jgi:hypothetical protein
MDTKNIINRLSVLGAKYHAVQNDLSKKYQFDQLAEIDRPFAMESDKGTVGRFELQEALVSSGKFHQNDAVIIIDEMLSMHKLEIVAVDTYRKNIEEID